MARIDVTLEGLNQLLHRIERKELGDADWAICGALVLDLILRKQGQQERLAARLAKGAVASAKTQVVDGQVMQSGDAPALGAGEDPGAAEPEAEAKRAKGHGRKGAVAFENAKHVVHALAAGLLGALCAACGLGRLTRYREKVVIRVVGQPLFAVELHHLEQARCRVCGRVARADAPAGLCDGVGSSYTVYDWSACAMLAVMHYFAAMPFKRLESLHQGWASRWPTPTCGG